MQVDRLNHLLFPPDSNPMLAGRDSAPAAGAHGRPSPVARQNTPAVVDRAHNPSPGVVLKIQGAAAEGLDGAAADAPVYTDARKVPTGTSDAADEAQMAQAHQQALVRNAGVVTRMSVDKDGVLVVAKPHAPVSEEVRAASTDFVSMAVSSMRAFADEAARVKAESAAANAAEPPVRLHGLQHLAARLKLFA